MKMHMRDYSILHIWAQIKVKEHSFYYCSAFHSHSITHTIKCAWNSQYPEVERYLLLMSIKVTSWHLAFVPIWMVYKSAFTKREVIKRKQELYSLLLLTKAASRY